ncbi:hypothetical protein B0H21DRAFT_756282 [Amylocystis lapponica]|nr:hypothetical protein B0H21DRAFT_756282 [Amylocystis lapponica]
MLSLLLAPIMAVYSYALQPVAPFTWLGLSFSALDVAAALRLCIALRQLREKFQLDHARQRTTDARLPAVETRSFVRNVLTTLTVVFGGEAVTATALGIPPSFMVSGNTVAFYTAIQAIVDRIPSIPYPTLYGELPVAVLDGFNRAMLLCTFVPPVVVQNPYKPVATSPWSLLLASFVHDSERRVFFINALSLLQPYALTLTTPAELLPYGWTATDLWCAPLITGLYALLTHAQPFWADAHGAVLAFLGAASFDDKPQPVDPEQARALCAALLAALFVTRTVKTFGKTAVPKPLAGPKEKVQ